MSYEQTLFLDQTHAAFRYVILINNEPMGAFTECTLPVFEWEMEEIKEGGLNFYVHQLPSRRKAARLTLKNGVGKSAVFDWFLAIANADTPPEKMRRTVSINLKDILGKDVCTWTLLNAFPLKWTGPQLQSGSSTIAIQTLEFVCGEVTISPANGANGQN